MSLLPMCYLIIPTSLLRACFFFLAHGSSASCVLSLLQPPAVRPPPSLSYSTSLSRAHAHAHTQHIYTLHELLNNGLISTPRIAAQLCVAFLLCQRAAHRREQPACSSSPSFGLFTPHVQYAQKPTFLYLPPSIIYGYPELLQATPRVCRLVSKPLKWLLPLLYNPCWQCQRALSMRHSTKTLTWTMSHHTQTTPWARPLKWKTCSPLTALSWCQARHSSSPLIGTHHVP